MLALKEGGQSSGFDKPSLQQLLCLSTCFHQATALNNIIGNIRNFNPLTTAACLRYACINKLCSDVFAGGLWGLDPHSYINIFLKLTYEHVKNTKKNRPTPTVLFFYKYITEIMSNLRCNSDQASFVIEVNNIIIHRSSLIPRYSIFDSHLSFR